MSDRVTVNFYHQDKGNQIQWMLHDAGGYVPVVGDFVITPAGTRWVVVARTWQQRRDMGISVLDCNVVVEDYTGPSAEVQA